ncbi:MAG: ankyrin repeat domain-containing protein [Endozoicomonas sp.]
MAEIEEVQKSQSILFNEMVTYITAHEKEKLTSLLEKHPDIVKFSAVNPEPTLYRPKKSTIIPHMQLNHPDPWWITNNENWEIIKLLIRTGAPLYEAEEIDPAFMPERNHIQLDNLWLVFDYFALLQLLDSENAKCTELFTEPRQRPMFPEFDRNFLSSMDSLKDKDPKFYKLYMNFRKDLFESTLKIYASNDSCTNRAAAILFKHTPDLLTGSLLKAIHSSYNIEELESSELTILPYKYISRIRIHNRSYRWCTLYYSEAVYSGDNISQSPPTRTKVPVAITPCQVSLKKVSALFTGEDPPSFLQRLASLFSAKKTPTDILSLRDRQGNSLLHYLAKSNNQDLWKQVRHQDLVSALNTQNENGQTPLHLALTHKDPSLAEQMIEMGARLDPDLKDSEGSTFLHYALRGSPNMALALMKNAFRTHILTQNKRQQTPFDLIIEAGDTRLVDFLVNQYSLGLDREEFQANVINLGGQLIAHNHLSLALKLLHNHSLICSYYLSEASTFSLQAAMCQGSVGIEEIHAPVSAIPDDPFGFSPLHILAMLSEQPQINKLLGGVLRKGVSEFPVDKADKTFIHYLVEKRQADLIFQALLEVTDIGSLFIHLYELIVTAQKQSDNASATALQMFLISTDLENAYQCRQGRLPFCARLGASTWSEQFTKELRRWQDTDRIDFDSLVILLTSGVNPNLGQSLDTKHPGTMVFTLADKIKTSVYYDLSTVILVILFGANVKDNIWKRTDNDRKLKGPIKWYQYALIKDSDTSFEDATELFRKRAKKVLQKIEIQGRLSHIHPICTCLSLSPVEDSQQKFQPFCQLSLVKANNEWFTRRVLEICESYGYTEFDEDSEDTRLQIWKDKGTED